jgi:hypothetical protein
MTMEPTGVPNAKTEINNKIISVVTSQSGRETGRQFRPVPLCFRAPSPIACGLSLTTGFTFSLRDSSRSFSLFELDPPLWLPSLAPVSVSTPRNPNALRCPSGRSFKLGARGRCWPRARPPIQGKSQRIMRYSHIAASRRMRNAQGPMVIRPRTNCRIRGRSATAS